MKINEIIKKRRLELGLSVDEIAQKLHINRATYYRYESKDIEKFPLDIVLPLSKILEIAPETLMGWEKPTENKQPVFIELETIAKDMDSGQLSRLLEYAKMLKQYKGD